MTSGFAQAPGTHERQLQIRSNNPLFPEHRRKITEDELALARQKDQQEAELFHEDFIQHVRQVAELGSHVESDLLLKLKGESDQLYERACGLCGNLENEKTGLIKIIASMMNAVRNGAVGDSFAMSEVAQEETARQTHFELLEIPLIADILRIDNPIRHDEMLPALLSLPLEEFSRALILFDSEQQGELYEHAQSLLSALSDSGSKIIRNARQNLALLKTKTTSG